MGQYNTAAVRQLLINALSDEDLGEFCMDYFPTVYEQFSAAMSKRKRSSDSLSTVAVTERFQSYSTFQKANPAAFAEYESV
jgi:hypothetical protein